MSLKMFLPYNFRFLQGIGRRVMECYGWRDGRGIGAEGREGRVEPVAVQYDGRIAVGDAEQQVQLPGESAGLGFHGPLVPQSSTQTQRQRPRPDEQFVRRANASGQTAKCITSSAPSGGRRLFALTCASASPIVSASDSNARQLMRFVPSGSVSVARAPSRTACASDSSSKALVSRPAPGVLAFRRPTGARLAHEKVLLEESLLRRSDADAQLKLRDVAYAATSAPGGYWTLNRNTHRN